MKAQSTEKSGDRARTVVNHNREVLRKSHVCTASIIGGPGCGRTCRVDATLERLMPEVHVGVIACDVTSHLDADRMLRHSDQVIQINTGGPGVLDPTQIRDALNWMDVNWLDVLFIENVGTLVGPGVVDLGQDVTVAMFSVAAGDDKAEKHAEIVRAADVIVLNKIDLLASVPFDVERFRADVKRLNPKAKLFEVSALRGEGIDAWIKWVKKPSKPVHYRASGWFG